MENKVALVTGSSSGIGEATALLLAKEGVKLVIHGTNPQRVQKVAQQCAQLSPNKIQPLEIVADLTDDEQVRRLLNTTIQHYGRLDFLVNNAGSYKPTKIDDPDFFELSKLMMRINYESIVLLTSLSAPYLKETKGSIVNVSSILHRVNIEGSIAYGAAKSALTAFSRSVAIELAPFVRVNSVSPGPIRTKINTEAHWEAAASRCLLGKVGDVGDAAEMIVFLLSPKSKWITGADYLVDGGVIAKPHKTN